jgi:release factor glutamine methyltransferase
MTTIAATLHGAARALHDASDSPRLDAELLLGKILGLPRSGLIAHGLEPVDDARAQAYAGLIALRLKGAPVAYLTGVREFWSLTLAVTPDVLVPRPETELLVELALQRLAADRPSTVLDLGTGSGAIALAIACERPHAQITATDISQPALEVAARNGRDLAAARNGHDLAAARTGRGPALSRALSSVDWRLGSWFEPVLGERFDLIVANPPYVAAADPALENLAAEPITALTPGDTGLEALAMIAGGAAAHLRPRGWLVLEHGADQGPAVAQLLARQGFTQIRSHLDFSHKPRVTLGTVHSPQ